MSVFEFLCGNCEYEWEDIMSWKDPIPEECPECGEKGCVKKLISLCATGVVKLAGRELKAKMKEDNAAFVREVHSSESLQANVVGESLFHQNELKRDAAKKDRPKIKTSKTGKKTI